MKLNLKQLQTSEDWELLGRQIYRRLVRLVRTLLVSRIRTTNVVVMLLILLVAAYLAAILLFLPPPGTTVLTPEALQFGGQRLDSLIERLAERAQESSRGLVIPSGTLFP